MVTIKQVAEKAGFSQATVSRLLKGDTSLSIAEETKKNDHPHRTCDGL